MAEPYEIQLPEIAEMRERGLSYQAIGIAVGVSGATIRRWLLPPDQRDRERETVRISTAAYDASHKEERLAYRVAHRTERNAKNADYYARNIDRYRMQHHEYSSSERAKEKARCRRAENLPRILAQNKARQAMILGATVGNIAEIELIYRRAKEEMKIRCYLCGELIPMGKRHVDHIVPLSRGGAHRPSNLAIACSKCNLSKKDKSPDEVGVLL
jgi:5-methylcytosine-specific restriction endonuclease McrA